jgi:hypothetical protein
MDGQCEYDPSTLEESAFIDEFFGFQKDLYDESGEE